MQSKTTKVAALIAIVLVSIVALNLFDSTTSVTWAGVIDPLMTAETAVFNVVTHFQGATMEAKIMVMGQRIRYESESSQGPPIVIFDTERFQMLSLIPEKKQAALIDMTDLAEEARENYLESIRDVIKELENDPDASIDRLPDSEVDGRNTIVFHAKNGDNELTVWANPKTLLPMRLEQVQDGFNIVYTDFQFDVELDPSLFSTDIPAGYSTASSKMDLDDATEKNALEGLRISQSRCTWRIIARRPGFISSTRASSIPGVPQACDSTRTWNFPGQSRCRRMVNEAVSSSQTYRSRGILLRR